MAINYTIISPYEKEPASFISLICQGEFLSSAAPVSIKPELLSGPKFSRLPYLACKAPETKIAGN